MAVLTVGYIAGFIALGILILEFLFPNLIAVLVASCIGHERSAVTWSVAGRDIQNTAWPLLLQTDTAASSHIASSIRALSWLRNLAVVLVACAGVITPLGLYTDIDLDTRTQDVPFTYVQDLGPMGYGTPTRNDDVYLNRICFNGLHISSCPFSLTRTNSTRSFEDGVLNITTHWDGTYDVRIPYTTAEVFNSVHDAHPHTVASSLDLAWRSWTYATKSPTKISINNGKSYPVGVFRYLDSLVLGNNIEAIEGLVVDLQDGGLGFRNHSGPLAVEYGAEWEEELLFVTPESACVDTNITLDFQIGPAGVFNDLIKTIVNISLTDRGGFADFDRDYDGYNRTLPDPQTNPDLYFRAHLGAWINTAYTMGFLNVTNLRTTEHPEASFSYIKSTVGQKFWIDEDDLFPPPSPNSLLISPRYGVGVPTMTSNYTDRRARYPNSFGVDALAFLDAYNHCSGNIDGAMANISNVAVSCGMMTGAAVPQEGSSLIFEPGSWWTQPLYSCATTSKASIKTVKFRWNSTRGPEEGLRRLEVLDIKEKVYADVSDQPYWAVENLHRQIRWMDPLWGIVSPDIARRFANDDHFDIVQSPHLYIPALSAVIGLLPGYPLDYNLPAADVFGNLVSSALSVDIDTAYSGEASLALFKKWQRLSSSAELAAKIPNLLWTDSAANALTGTRSWASSNDLPEDIQPPINGQLKAQQESPGRSGGNSQVPVRLYRSRIKYHWPFAIPALLTVFLLLIVLVLAAGFAVLGRLAGPKTMRYYLHTTSAGRLLAYIAEGKENDADADPVDRRQYQPKIERGGLSILRNHAGLSPPVPIDTEQWLAEVGWRKVDLVGIDTNLHGILDDDDSGRQDRPAYTPVSPT